MIQNSFICMVARDSRVKPYAKLKLRLEIQKKNQPKQQKTIY